MRAEPRAGIGCAWMPHLPLSVVLRDRPECEGKPVIVGDEGEVVVDASPECLASGVRLGRPVREAREYRPDAVCLPQDPEGERRAHEGLLEAIEVIAPRVEEEDPGRTCFELEPPAALEDARWMLSWLRELVRERVGLPVRLALAPDRFTARTACERDPEAAKGGRIVLEGEEAEYLSPLPVGILPLPPRAVERLRLLGITTVGRFARLPREGVARRFGREAVEAHWMACGEDSRPVVGRVPQDTRSARWAFDSSVETTEPILAATQRLLERLCAELRTEGKTFRRLRITLEDEVRQVTERTAELRVPTVEPAACVTTVRALVEGAGGGSPVAAVSVELASIAPIAVGQPSLFDTSGRQERRERLREAAREIGRRYPARLRRVSPSEVPTLLDEHRFALLPYEPDDRRPAPSGIPPASQHGVLVGRRNGRPYLVEGGHWDELLTVCGCWRAEEWWPEEVERVYWRVRTRSGRIVTLSRDGMGFRLIEVLD